MNQVLQSSRWLYLLAAVMLLMQATAIWHDATHPFHIADSECERFEAVQHNPTVLISQAGLPVFTALFSVVAVTIPPQALAKRNYNYHPIRAPPTLS